MKFIAAVTALIFAGLAAIMLAPLAFSQVLPLPDVLIQTAPAILVTPTAEAPAACTDVQDYIDAQRKAGFDTITLTHEEAQLLADTNEKAGTVPVEVETVVLINPDDGDYKSDIIYLGAYDKKGCYWGQATWSRDILAKGLADAGLARPATAEKPAA